MESNNGYNINDLGDKLGHLVDEREDLIEEEAGFSEVGAPESLKQKIADVKVSMKEAVIDAIEDHDIPLEDIVTKFAGMYGDFLSENLNEFQDASGLSDERIDGLKTIIKQSFPDA